MSAELPGGSEASDEQRAQAAALWRALNARPEDILRDSQRLEALEKDLAALRQSTQRHDAAIAGLRSELQASQTGRYANPLVFGLLALLLAAVAAALYAWRRTGWHATSGGDWWRTRDGQASDLPSTPPVPARRAAASPVTHPELGSDPNLEVDSSLVDLDLNFTESALQRLQQEPSARQVQQLRPSGRHDDFQQSQPASMRAVRAEELHDVQQEADFFVSLGDPDRAIEVLRNHISMNPGTSAVAWLDLLEIHHKLQRREAYEAVRREFIRNFDVQVPEFDAYREGQAGLEDYGNAMTRITSLWPSRKVLDLIEESIFRKPGQPGAEAFSLEAYRDLLLLHHVGRDLVHSAQYADSDGATGSGFSNTAIHPLLAQAMRDPAPEPAFPDIDPVVLDINLDEPAGADEPLIGASEPLPPVHGNLLDFDLPDVDTTQLKPKKTRE